MKTQFNVHKAKLDELVKSQFSPPLAGGDEGEGERTVGNTVAYHPHPNPPPSRGREVGTFDESIKFNVPEMERRAPSRPKRLVRKNHLK
jgi:hypothetical protein